MDIEANSRIPPDDPYRQSRKHSNTSVKDIMEVDDAQ